MKDEIVAAVVFLTKLVKKNSKLSKNQLEQFQKNLTATLLDRFKDHWYETTPSKGQGYRCIRINDNERVDPVLEEAAKKSGLRFDDLRLRTELTLWVDPLEVCCRLGETHGAYCTVALFYNGEGENKAKSIDIDKMLNHHHERKQAEHAKFVKATSSRTKRRISPETTRVSPTVVSMAPYTAGPPPQCQNVMAYQGGWDESRNGYHGNEPYYGQPGFPAVESGNHNNQVTWGNWGNGHVPRQQLSPGSNGGLVNGNSGDLPSTGVKTNPGQLITGGAHLSKQSTFLSHNGNKFRWVKPAADAAKA